MSELKMTPTRVQVLRAVADPRIEVYASVRSSGSWATADVYLSEYGRAERKITAKVAELESAGLVKRDHPGVRYHSPRHYSLTAAGERVLADLDAATAGKD